MSASDMLLGAVIGAGAFYFYGKRRGGLGDVSWSKKDERMYSHIVDGCTRPKKVCKRIAAATVNKRRRLEGRTLGGVPQLNEAQHKRRIKELRRLGCKVTLVEQPYGTVVLKKCPPGVRPSALEGCGCEDF